MGDGTRLNREAYAALVAEDLAWLDRQPRTSERDHVALIVRGSLARADADLAGDRAVAELRRLDAEARSAPWAVMARGPHVVAGTVRNDEAIGETSDGEVVAQYLACVADAELIVAMRNALGPLLDRLDRAEAAAAEARAWWAIAVAGG